MIRSTAQNQVYHNCLFYYSMAIDLIKHDKLCHAQHAFVSQNFCSNSITWLNLAIIGVYRCVHEVWCLGCFFIYGWKHWMQFAWYPMHAGLVTCIVSVGILVYFQLLVIILFISAHFMLFFTRTIAKVIQCNCLTWQYIHY